MFYFYKFFSVLGVEILTEIEEEIDAVAVLVQGVDLSEDHVLHQRRELIFSFDTVSKKLSCSHD